MNQPPNCAICEITVEDHNTNMCDKCDPHNHGLMIKMAYEIKDANPPADEMPWERDGRKRREQDRAKLKRLKDKEPVVEAEQEITSYCGAWWEIDDNFKSSGYRNVKTYERQIFTDQPLREPLPKISKMVVERDPRAMYPCPQFDCVINEYFARNMTVLKNPDGDLEVVKVPTFAISAQYENKQIVGFFVTTPEDKEKKPFDVYHKMDHKHFQKE